jgi:hypothetical protein
VQARGLFVGEIETVGGFVRTFIPGREVDGAVEATIEFQNGARAARSHLRGRVPGGQGLRRRPETDQIPC